MLAELELDAKFAPIPLDTRAILRQKSLLGETYVELTPGDADGEKLPDGGTLPGSQVAETVEFEELFSTFDSETQKAFQDWLQEAGVAVGGGYAQRLQRLARQPGRFRRVRAPTSSTRSSASGSRCAE